MSIPGTEPATTAGTSPEATPVKEPRARDGKAASSPATDTPESNHASGGAGTETLHGGANSVGAAGPAFVEPAHTQVAPPPAMVNVPFAGPVNQSVLPGRSAPPPIVRQRRPAARRARLTLSRLDPWSVLKTSFVFATCLFIVWMIAVIVLFSILNGAGVFKSINDTLSDVLGTHISFSGFAIIGGAAILGAFNVVLVSALGTVIAFAYNVTSSLVGGIEVTLTESE